MAGLKAVPDAVTDLSEFYPRSGPPASRRWEQVLAVLTPADEANLRAALLTPAIADYAISLWFERRDIVVDPRTIKGWRRRRYATL